MASESHCHRQQSLSSSDSSRTVDLTVIHDTIAILRTETLWREPDSLGKIYPLITTKEEQSAKRTALKETKVTRVDTLYITDNTDHTSTATAKSSAGYSPPAREGYPFLRWLPWLLLLLLLLVVVIGLRTKD